MGVFAPQGAYAPNSYSAPKEVDSVVNHRVYRGRDIVVQAAGGVRCDVMAVAKDPKRNKVSTQLDGLTTTSNSPQSAQGRWWWDAAK